MKTIHDLIGRYWDIAYKEGKTGISYGTEAQEVLSEINSFIVAKDAGPVPYLHPAHDDTALLRQALNALENMTEGPRQRTITALRERLGE